MPKQFTAAITRERYGLVECRLEDEYPELAEFYDPDTGKLHVRAYMEVGKANLVFITSKGKPIENGPRTTRLPVDGPLQLMQLISQQLNVTFTHVKDSCECCICYMNRTYG